MSALSTHAPWAADLDPIMTSVQTTSLTNLIKALFMTTTEIRNAAWDFYVMGNETAACLCIMELKRRDPKGTAAWIDEMINA